MIGARPGVRVRPTRADKANIADLWEWAFGGNQVVGVDEHLRGIKRELRIQTYVLVGAVLLANPVTAHFAEPLLKSIFH
jgi:hypothetical protein